MAETEGIRSLGTLGILLRALDQHLLVPDETREPVDRLIESHSFRIDIRVYQAVLNEIRRER